MSKSKKFNWKYCECGCHGFELSVGGQYYWCLDRLDGTFILNQGHAWMSGSLGEFKSWKEVNNYVKNDLNKIRKELDKAL
jgi:hypothetical protein